MKFRRLILAAALALVAVPAFAQPGAPYAIAASKDFSWQVVIGDTGSGRKFTPMGTPGGVVKVAGSVVLPSGQSGRGLWVVPTFTTFTSGTTAEISGVLVDTPLITSSGATITAAANLKVAAAPSAGSANYSMWVVGAARLDSTVLTNAGAATLTLPSQTGGVATTLNCGATGSGNQTCSPTAANALTKVYAGSSTLAASSAVITFPTAFTATTSYQCVANDITTRANPVQMVSTSTTTATITNTTGATDVINWVCVGQ